MEKKDEDGEGVRDDGENRGRERINEGEDVGVGVIK